MFLASYVAGLQPYVTEGNQDPYFTEKADVTKDGNVGLADVVYMASNIAGLPGFEIPPNEPEPEPEKQYTQTPGDVNNDGEFDSADVVFLASYVAGLQPYVSEGNQDPNFTEKADVTKDGNVGLADVVHMASNIAGLPGFEIPPNEPEPEPEPES